MRRELYALAVGALGVTLLLDPARAAAQEPSTTDDTTQPTPQPAPAPQTVVVEPAPAPAPEPARVVVVPSPRQVATETETTTEVNSPVITTGVITFGLSYGAAAFAGASSDRSSDKRLYVPLLGPWLAIADRGDCPVDQAKCDSQTTDKVLMAIDGVFQAAGAITVVYGILSPRTVTHRTTASRDVHVVPLSMGQGSSAGLGVTGSF